MVRRIWSGAGRLAVIAGAGLFGTAIAVPGEGPPLVPSHGPIVPLEQDHADARVGPLTWKAPATWKPTPPKSAMRVAQYSLPAATGDPAEGECVVFYFGAGQGGDAKGNVDRWRSQFTAADGGPAPSRVGEMKVAGKVITKVESSGTYKPTPMGPGDPPPPKSGWMMLGAIVPGADANWFFRCTGPQKTMEAERSNFDALLASIR